MKSKHLLLTLLLAVFVPWAANAQSLNEGFEDATFPPADWTAIHVSGSQTWTRSTGTGAAGSSAFAFRKDVSGGYNDYLITPQLIPAAGDELSFYLASQYAAFYSSTTLTIEVSTTTPTVDAFTDVLAMYNSGSDGNFGTTDESDWVNKTVDVSAYVGQQIYIAFHATDPGYNADVRIDNVTGVTLFVPACPKPTGLAVNYTSGTEAIVTWNGDAYSYNIDVNGTVTNHATSPYQLTGLELATTYQVKVQSDCGNDLSDWTNPVSFTTDLCLPENMCELTFELTDSYGDSWNGAYIAVVDVATGQELAQMANENLNGTQGAGENELNIKTLAVCDGREIQFVWHSGSYDSECSFVIKDINEEEIVSGNSSALPFTYTVSCTPPACPKPQGLTVSYTGGTEATVTWNGDAYSYNIDVNGTVTNHVTSPYQLTGLELATTYEVKVQSDCGNDLSDWTNPVSFTTDACLPENMCELTFKLTDAYGDGWNGAYIAVVDVATGTELAQMAADNHNVQQTTTTDTKILSVCDGREIQFVWHSGSYDSECSFVIKDINEEEIVSGNSSALPFTYTVECTVSTCRKPTNLAATEIGPRSAVLSWTENGEATEWVLEVSFESAYGPSSIYPSAGTNPFTLDGLDPEKQYTVKVRPVCIDADDKWSDPITFITGVACPAPTNLTVTNLMPTSATLNWTGEAESYNVRYGVAGDEVTIFEDGFENGLDNWTVISNGEYTQLPWMQFNVDDFGNSQYTNHNGSYVAMSRSYTGSADVSVDNWLITPQVTLDGDLKYWVINDDNFGYAEQYAIYVSTTGNSINDFTLLYTPGNNTTWTEHVVDLRSFNGALGYIAIRHQDYAKDFLLIDDFGIYATQEAGEWTNATSTTNSLDITGLTSVTNYAFQVQAICGGEDGMSQWSTVANFTTPDGCAAPTGLAAEDITHNSATLNWTGITDTYNLRYCEVDPTASATIILNVPDDVWGDGSGYQMLIDADATAYDDGDFSDYSIFEYLIPTDATYDPNTTGIVINNSVTIQIPAGTYDWIVTNPSPDYNAVYVAGNNGNVHGAENNFVFEAGKTYEFTLYLVSNSDGDGVDLTITGDANAWTLVEGVTSPYTLENLSAQTMYEYQVQGVNCDGNGGTTDWSASATFTTNMGYYWNQEEAWPDDEIPTEYSDVTIPDNTTIIIPDGYTAYADEITIEGTGSILIEDGGQLYHNNEVPVVFQMNVDGYQETRDDNPDNDGYRLIASPVYESSNNLSVAIPDAMLEGNYDLYLFDQTQNQAEWRNQKNGEFSTLDLGKGYLYANTVDVFVVFAGQTLPTIANMQVDLTYDANANLAGWNLVGNPYTAKAYVDRPHYVLNEKGDEVIAVTQGESIPAMKGVFVQATEEGQFCNFSTTPQNVSMGSLSINLRQANTLSDRAIVNFGEGRQMGKFNLRQNSTRIYMPIEGKDYAVANAEGNVGEMPVSFKAEKNGSYTLSFTSEAVNFSYLHLIDNMTGDDTDLLANPNYTFNATTTDYANRFRLVFATDSSVDGDSFGFFNGAGNLCIFGIEGEATVQVVDVLGHVLSSETFSGSYERKLSYAPGVYMIRLINGNDVKVQKVVVR